jgi:uncharacterized protein YbjT (DUF2867 family)
VSASPTDVVTGAFGYSGRYLARRLRSSGRRVRTLTNNPEALQGGRGGDVEVHPLRFEDRAGLVAALRGAATLYNTYWVRFTHKAVDYERAVENTRTLFAAAVPAGVERVVHVSITNADEASPLPYFRWKGVLERELRDSGLDFAIVRPTVLFGREDILINNIGWLLRRLPAFVVPGDGDYRLQPVYVDDLAALCIEVATGAAGVTLDAVGPEIYTFDQLVRTVRRATGSRARIVHAPTGLALALAQVVGFAMRDVLVTADELRGLQANLLVSDRAPTGATSFEEWATTHGSELGRRYASELQRHYRR